MLRTRQKIKGICRICGEEKELSFEHIPPQSLGNTREARLRNGVTILENDRFIWDIGDLKYAQRQQGIGFFTICRECNSYKGIHYDNYFKDFYLQISDERAKYIGGKPFPADVMLTNVYPLRILKYMVSALLTISKPKWAIANPNLQRFARYKDDNNFDLTRYHLDAYLRIGAFRAEQFFASMMYSGNFLRYRPLKVSYVDLADMGFHLISDFSCNSESFGRFAMRYGIDESFTGSFRLLCVERNSFVPFDFRTQQEIIMESEEAADY